MGGSLLQPRPPGTCNKKSRGYNVFREKLLSLTQGLRLEYRVHCAKYLRKYCPSNWGVFLCYGRRGVSVMFFRLFMQSPGAIHSGE